MTYRPVARALTFTLLTALALTSGAAVAAPRQGDAADGAPARAPAADAGAPLLKQPPMPMRRTTHAQRKEAADKHRALREADAASKGQPVQAARKMPQPQKLPESRDNK
jgi:hypothetical protein